jgi:hypothetical protein
VREARNGGLRLGSEGDVYWVREGQVSGTILVCVDCGEGRAGEDKGSWEVDRLGIGYL